jgi:hypothetical protein
VSDAGARPALEASAPDVSQETAGVVDASVYSCFTRYFCTEYHDGQSPSCPAEGTLLPRSCDPPTDPANDICVLEPGVLIYYYPDMIPYPGVDGGFVTLGAPPPECTRP